MSRADRIMAYFFSTDIPNAGSEIDLSREESQHLSKTLRGKAGDVIEIINGHGLTATAEIISIDRKLIFDINDLQKPLYKFSLDATDTVDYEFDEL